MVVLLRISSLAVAAMVYTCVSVSAFIVPSPSWSIRMVPSTATGGNYNNKYVIGALLSSNEDENESMSFSDAEQAIREEEEERRMQQRGDDSEEDKRKFDANKSSYEDMRAKIRARASEMGVEKSVATAEAIKAATARAQAGESAKEQTVDLSKFGADFLDPVGGEEELTEEQKQAIDPVSTKSILEQIQNEIQNTRFPTPGATLKQAGLMVVIFLVTAGLILKVDEVLRIQITDWGFIPGPNDIGDYSDLALPEGFTDMMSDTDLEKMN